MSVQTDGQVGQVHRHEWKDGQMIDGKMDRCLRQRVSPIGTPREMGPWEWGSSNQDRGSQMG